jgi:hypothetical protein
MKIVTLELAIEKLTANRLRFPDKCWRAGDPIDEITREEIDVLIDAGRLTLLLAKTMRSGN